MKIIIISMARLDSQSRKFAPILIIILTKNAHFFVCRQTRFVHHRLRNFVKMTLTRVFDCDSCWVILWKRWLDSSHHFSQHDSSRVRVIKNRDSSHTIKAAHLWGAAGHILSSRPVLYVRLFFCYEIVYFPRIHWKVGQHHWRVARWCQIWQILPKITLFQKICQLFLGIFFMPKICLFWRTNIVTMMNRPTVLAKLSN